MFLLLELSRIWSIYHHRLRFLPVVWTRRSAVRQERWAQHSYLSLTTFRLLAHGSSRPCSNPVQNSFSSTHITSSTPSARSARPLISNKSFLSSWVKRRKGGCGDAWRGWRVAACWCQRDLSIQLACCAVERVYRQGPRKVASRPMVGCQFLHKSS